MDVQDIIKVEHLKRVDVQPGDRFVFTAPRPLRSEEARYLQDTWARFMGGSVEEFPLFILADGMELGVIRNQVANARA